jgi:hypothetical protein
MSTISYTDAGKVAQALAFQSPETLSAAVAVGATSITLNANPPVDWTVGSTLILDVNNPSIRETVTILAISGSALTISAVKNAHTIGSPVVNGTIVSNYVSPASRWFDSVTFNQSGFGYETVTEKKSAYIGTDGFITIPLSKPMVDINDVMDVTFQSTPLDPIDSLDISKAWIEDNYFLNIATPRTYYRKTGQATVVYSGGYNPVPDDIVQAVTVMAARFYKERDSGYSDVIASTETGVMQYQKAMPADVKMVVDKYRRWTE